jgi:hypothetical protein
MSTTETGARTDASLSFAPVPGADGRKAAPGSYRRVASARLACTQEATLF